MSQTNDSALPEALFEIVAEYFNDGDIWPGLWPFNWDEYDFLDTECSYETTDNKTKLYGVFDAWDRPLTENDYSLFHFLGDFNLFCDCSDSWDHDVLIGLNGWVKRQALIFPVDIGTARPTYQLLLPDLTCWFLDCHFSVRSKPEGGHRFLTRVGARVRQHNARAEWIGGWKPVTVYAVPNIKPAKKKLWKKWTRIVSVEHSDVHWSEWKDWRLQTRVHRICAALTYCPTRSGCGTRPLGAFWKAVLAVCSTSF
jgi:hypothetical protein